MQLVKSMDISKAMSIKLSDKLPSYPKFVEEIRRAPSRGYSLNPTQTKISLKKDGCVSSMLVGDINGA